MTYLKRRSDSGSAQVLSGAKTADHAAVAAGIALKADLSIWDENGITGLGYAIQRRDAPLVELLLHAGANPNQIFGADNIPPLTAALENGDLASARLLLLAGANVYGGDVLHRCATRGDVDAVDLLLEFCNQPDAAVAPSRTDRVVRALHGTIESPLDIADKLSVIRVFLDHGVNVQAASSSTAMDLAVRHSQAEVGDLLRSYGAAYTAREAVAFNRIEEVKSLVLSDPSLLQQRCAPYYAARPGQEPTLLGMAAERGDFEMAKFLIDAGAPLEQREWYDLTLLHLAAMGGNVELIRLLVGRGLDVNARDEDGNTPLHTAVARMNPDAILALLELDADPTLENRFAFSAIILAENQGGAVWDAIKNFASQQHANAH